MTLPQFQHRRCHFLLPDSASESPTLLLLDTYPGAVAAYSLRKLRSAYSGALIRVRRSSDNAEADIGFSGSALDTAALLAHCGAGDGFVTTWYDQSGNGEDHTQSTAGRQPQIVVSGSVNAVDGYPALLGDGARELVGSISFSQPVHMFAVARTGTAGGGLFGSTNGADVRLFYYLSGASRMYAGGSILTGTGLSNDTKYLFSCLLDGADSIIRVNGQNDASGTNPGAQNSGPSTKIMSYSSVSNGWNGDLLEMVVYDANKTSDQAGIETAMNTQYSVY